MSYRTPQELFDVAVRFQRYQGTRCEVDGEPKYRNGDRACPIGVFLFAEYKSAFEGEPLNEQIREAARIAPEDHYLARALQVVHDDCEPEHWVDKWIDIAKTWELNPEVIVETM